MTTLKRRTFLSAGAAAALGTVSGIAQAKSFDPMPGTKILTSSLSAAVLPD